MFRINSAPVFVTFSILLLLPLSGLQAQTSGAAPNQASAADLISDAQRAVGQVVNAAKTDPNLKTDNAEAKPFWQAMKYLNESLGGAESGLSRKDESFFTNLATAVAAVQQAEIALTMNSPSNPAVTSGMNTVAGIVTAIDENFSKETAGPESGEMTAAEKKQLKEIQSKTRELEKNLKNRQQKGCEERPEDAGGHQEDPGRSEEDQEGQQCRRCDALGPTYVRLGLGLALVVGPLGLLGTGLDRYQHRHLGRLVGGDSLRLGTRRRLCRHHRSSDSIRSTTRSPKSKKWTPGSIRKTSV